MNRDIRRYDEIDIMKGLGIILIILGHLEPSTYLMRFVYSFHLFVFFTCSGFVGTRYLTRGFRSIICNNIKRLLIPYIVWNILSQTVDIMCGTINTVQAINNILFLNANCGWNAALWFLASLFWIDSLGALIIKSIKSYYLQMSICLLFGILWIFMWTNKLILPFGLYTIPAGMIFWFIGYYFNITHTLNYLSHIGNKGLFYIGFLGGGGKSFRWSGVQ